jgi:glutathione S-transferase
VKRKFRRDIVAQGLGRHTAAEIYAMGVADLRAVSAWLTDKPCFMGGEPTGADATVYALVASAIATPFDSPLKQEGKAQRNLSAYVDRVTARFFSGGELRRAG